jgi:hypothetical protein
MTSMRSIHALLVVSLAAPLALACGGAATGSATAAAPDLDPGRPCGALAVAELDAALGGAVTVSGAPESSPTQCKYNLADGSGSVQLYVFDTKSLYDFHRNAVDKPEARPLDGLGDDALGKGSEAFVGYGGKAGFRVVVFSMGGELDTADRARVATEVARRVAGGAA